MARVIIIFSLAVIVCVTAQRTPFGPYGPLNNFPASSCSDNLLVADELNMCWYHRCERDGNLVWQLKPVACPIGTRLPYTYTQDIRVPCTIHYSGNYLYECSRERRTYNETRPHCATITKCYNGGQVKYEHGYCWCDCPADWQGDTDCSKRTFTNRVEITGPSSKCPGGVPDRDYCALYGGCLNRGTCKNQCDGFWCECPTPYRFGKRCERFSCEREDECFNDGECRRGFDGLNEFRRCICPPLVYGYRCEDDRRPKTTTQPPNLVGQA